MIHCFLPFTVLPIGNKHNVRFDQNEKDSTYNALDILPFFQTFSRSGKFWANFKTFSRIQDSVRTLDVTTKAVHFPQLFLGPLVLVRRDLNRRPPVW